MQFTRTNWGEIFIRMLEKDLTVLQNSFCVGVVTTEIYLTTKIYKFAQELPKTYKRILY